MAIYVDKLRAYPTEGTKPRTRVCCHLLADSEAELVDFAINKLGLARSSIRRGSTLFVHVDLTPGKRAQAVRLGAIEVEK
jgi:hypothetical protein